MEGVVRWWLLEQAIVEETAYAKEALAELVKKGLLVEHTGTDGRVHYRINELRRDEIVRFAEGEPE